MNHQFLVTVGQQYSLKETGKQYPTTYDTLYMLIHTAKSWLLSHWVSYGFLHPAF